jgi:hypothetical protein
MAAFYGTRREKEERGNICNGERIMGISTGKQRRRWAPRTAATEDGTLGYAARAY